MSPKPPNSQQDMAGMAKDLRLAADLIEANGLRALHALASWQVGPRSPNLDPATSNTSTVLHCFTHQRDNCECGQNTPLAVPSDPTGSASLDDELSKMYDRLVLTLEVLRTSAPDAIHAIRAACPNVEAFQLQANEMTDAQISAAGWCISCFRDGGYHNPVATTATGKRIYRDLCSWCGKWATAHGGVGRGSKSWPPLRLVEIYHERGRVTRRDEELVEAEGKAPKGSARKRNSKAIEERRHKRMTGQAQEVAP